MSRTLALLLVPALALAAAPPADSQASEELRQATMSELLDQGGWVPASVVASARRLSPALRADAARKLVEVVRRYTETAAFVEAWAAGRKEREPAIPQRAKSADELQAEARAELSQSIRDAEEAMKQVPPEMRGEMRRLLEETRAQGKAIAEDRRAFEERAKIERLRAAEERLEHELLRDRFAAELPADPRAALRRRLGALLAETADVSFDAKVVEDGGRTYFADEALEAKSNRWKLCFRAGREACTAARDAAQAWLRALGR